MNLDEVDRDGAIREGYEEALGDTRLSFLKKGAVAGGAALSGGAILSALVPGSAFAAETGGPPASPFGTGAIGILNFALTLEYLESSFYNAAAKGVKGLNSQEKNFLKTVVADEAAHVAYLKKGLGSKAIGKPTFNFGKAVTDKATFLATAYVLENTGVHAYLGQAPNLVGTPYLVPAATIVTVEARHAGAIATILGKSIAPNGPFDSGESAADILKAVNGTKFITKL